MTNAVIEYVNTLESMITTCRSCIRAAWVLRRVGFKDTIDWGAFPDGRDRTTIHAYHSNCDKLTRKAQYERPVGHNGKFEIVERDADMLASLCMTYRNELAWLTAGRPNVIFVYMAHPVAPSKYGDFKANIKSADRWLKYLRSLSASQCSELTKMVYAVKPIIHAPWLAGIVPDEEAFGGREAMITEGKNTATLYDEVWYTNRISSGMLAEGSVAMVSRDLTWLGKEPPRPGTIPKIKVTNGRSK